QCLKKTILTASGCLILSATTLHAQEPDTCDQDYYDVLGARAYLEGKREMEAAQRIILKNDSVLEYSCFHLDLDRIGVDGGSFSEGGLLLAGNPPEFDGGIGISGGNLDNAISITLFISLIEFLESFRHDYLGGTIATLPAFGIGCSPMNIVWNIAKCENFDEDTWVSLESLSSTDIRIYPSPCDSFDIGRDARIDAAFDASYPPPATPDANGGIETLTTYIDYITGPCAGATPLQTGIIAEINVGGTNYDVADAVCVRPGCSYQPLLGSPSSPGTCN
ncbi:MAG: hypothetical protein AAF244_05400, partial [Pseudomonadota bacterium]